MAGKKRAPAARAGKGKANVTGNSRTTIGSSSAQDGGFGIYNEMLAEALAGQSEQPERPLKKRRTGHQRAVDVTKPSQPQIPSDEVDNEEEEEDLEFEDVIKVDQQSLDGSTFGGKPQQMIYRSDEEDESEASDMEWQPVDFDALDGEKPSGDLEFTLSRPAVKQEPTVRRRVVTKADRQLRLQIHKLHLLCLLSHVSRRNKWCNDKVVHSALKPLLDKKMRQFLKPKPDLSQFGRAESLKRGLEMVSHMWKKRFTVTQRGIRRALWAEDAEDIESYKLPEDSDTVLDKEDFRKAAEKLEGSRDLGAQLYCALLRSVGVPARLVCSLQPLSFNVGGPPMPQPVQSTPKKAMEDSNGGRQTETTQNSDMSSPASGHLNNPRRRLGHPLAADYLVPYIANPPAPPPKAKKKVIRESPYPVYWIEVLDEAHQKWLPVDPMVTDTIGKARVFEPPAADHENNMTYVVAFESSGCAKDVTRRYVKAYNAKTRRNRVDVTDGGSRWWRKTMRLYAKEWISDVDQIEDTELAAAEAREPMPKNIADFKDHPTYALERHLRRNEVLVRTQEIGKVAAGRDPSVPGGKKLESVYRRRDVRVARSADAWYRLGRDVKMGELPIKVAPPKPKGDVMEDDEAQAGTNLYSIDQTELYKSPPCVDGQVPKNSFGNIDLFVPTMVPDGGVHIPHPEAARAARILGIDYSDALVGFEFRGRQGTAVLKGVVVAVEYGEAVEAVIEGFKDEEASERERLRTVEVLKKWRYFLKALRIRQRIGEYVVEGDDDQNVEDVSDDPDDEYVGGHSDQESEYGGGFIPE